ncbi:MAG: hypothetical protein ACXW27_01900 [Allosphingosinicella sp.]
MSLDHLMLSKDARDLLREHRIETIDRARSWTQWENVSKIRDIYIAHQGEFKEIQLAVAAYDQQKGSTFRDCYVSFMDILGFSELALRADTDPEAREIIRLGLRGFSSILRRYPNPDLHFSQFSDSIVLSAARNENGLLYVIEATIKIAFELLKAGLLVRGGIVAGNLEHTDEMLFGQALVDAHKLDQRGGPPRIIVDKMILNDPPAQRLLTEIWSPSIFLDEYDLSDAVHTLLHAESYRDDSVSAITAAELKAMADKISEQANDPEAAACIRAKWRWMARYWNRVASKNEMLPTVGIIG